MTPRARYRLERWLIIAFGVTVALVELVAIMAVGVAAFRRMW